jgi:protein-S-isoprenylcysteine O-methyltransferase Ste14
MNLKRASQLATARVTFGGRSFHVGANPTEGGLVTKGPYRFVRHPIAEIYPGYAEYARRTKRVVPFLF